MRASALATEADFLETSMRALVLALAIGATSTLALAALIAVVSLASLFYAVLGA